MSGFIPFGRGSYQFQGEPGSAIPVWVPEPDCAELETNLRGALGQCLSVMLRMIPQACEKHGLEQCTDAEHDQAIAAAATALYGKDRAKWAPVLRDAAEGKFE